MIPITVGRIGYDCTAYIDGLVQNWSISVSNGDTAILHLAIDMDLDAPGKPLNLIIHLSHLYHCIISCTLLIPIYCIKNALCIEIVTWSNLKCAML